MYNCLSTCCSLQLYCNTGLNLYKCSITSVYTEIWSSQFSGDIYVGLGSKTERYFTHPPLEDLEGGVNRVIWIIQGKSKISVSHASKAY